jgi:hypothetical protein
LARGDNDTYRHFVRGNSGYDLIYDTGGKDKLVLTNYSRSEVRGRPYDVDNNGKPDGLQVKLGKGNQNQLIIGNYFDNTK